VIVALISLGPIVSQIFQNVGKNLQTWSAAALEDTSKGPATLRGPLANRRPASG